MTKQTKTLAFIARHVAASKALLDFCLDAYIQTYWPGLTVLPARFEHTEYS